MIQRLQSILLALAIVINLASLYVPLWQYQNGSETEILTGMRSNAVNADSQITAIATVVDNVQAGHIFHLVFFGMTIAASALLAVVIFMYSNRVKQRIWAFGGIILICIEILTLVLLTQKGPFIIPGSSEDAAVQFGFAFPVLAVLLVWYATKRIQADEDLVRSLDRLR